MMLLCTMLLPLLYKSQLDRRFLVNQLYIMKNNVEMKANPQLIVINVDPTGTSSYIVNLIQPLHTLITHRLEIHCTIFYAEK